MTLYYQDDFVTLYQGDCFNVLPTIEEKVDLVLCDPPYHMLNNCKWDYSIDLSLLWRNLHTLAHERTAYVFTGAQPFTSKLVLSNPKEFKFELIWQKRMPTGFLNVKKMPLRNHENILVFYRKQPVYNPQMTQGKPYKAKHKPNNVKVYGSHSEVVTDNTTGLRYPVSVLCFPHDKERYHPTQKPVALCEYIVKTYSQESGLVLDPFAGSGSSLVAAKRAGRRAIGIELDPSYCDIIVQRLQNENQNNLSTLST